MKKVLSLVIVLLIISVVACKPEIKKEAPGTETPAIETPKVETTGDAAVDTVGKDLGNVDSVEKDLSPDQLGDLDSGLTDVQDI